MKNLSYIDAFIPEGKEASQCSNCGICLQKCPVMKMGVEESKAEIARLINGEDPKRVFDECSFCFSCNHYCPQGLRPYNLIMERITAKYRDSGKDIPRELSYMMTGKNETGFVFDQYNAAPDEDKAILVRWSKVPPKAKDTLFIGCHGRTVPGSIEHSRVLSSLVKFGPRDACCGELAYRFGDIETFVKTVERTYRQLEALETDRLVCYCGSCSNFLGNVWPNYHKIKLPFKVISLYEWIWEKYQAGELSIQRQDPRKIVVSDSCYTSELGDGFYEALRGLYKASGMSLIELENNRYDSLCCGMATALRESRGDRSEVAVTTKKKMEQIRATKEKEVICNCPGCVGSLSHSLKLQGVKVSFGVNEILWAFGDDREYMKELKRDSPSGGVN